MGTMVKKQSFSWLVSGLCMLFLLSFAVPPASAAEERVTPYKPDWIAEEDYVVFPPDSLAYHPAIWAQLMEYRRIVTSGEKLFDPETQSSQYFFRHSARSYMEGGIDHVNVQLADHGTGSGDLSVEYEIALLEYGYYRGGQRPGDILSGPVGYSIRPSFQRMRQLFAPGSPEWMALSRLMVRANFWSMPEYVDRYIDEAAFVRAETDLIELTQYPGFDRAAFLQHPDFDLVRHHPSFQQLELVTVAVDTFPVEFDAPPRLVNDRIVVPIRPVCEMIGADVFWAAESRTVTIVRAGKTIELTLDQPSASVNGRRYTLDAAPALIDGVTMLPLRFIMEQMGQAVHWDAAGRIIRITEDMSFEGDSNIRAWLFGMNAILSASNKFFDPYILGGLPRLAEGVISTRSTLAASWGITDREDLIFQLLVLLENGHSSSFAYQVEALKTLAPEDLDQLMADAEAAGQAYFVTQLFDWDKKWESKRLKAWDWFRAGTLCAMGYRAGYLDLREAYILTEPFARLLRETFTSWDEAVENYLDGFAYWAHIDVTAPFHVSEFQQRAVLYKSLKSHQAERGLLFDPQVWVESVRGMSREGIAEDISL
jgi:hypothetical protein